MAEQPHFVLFPFLAQGHMIPMMDIARLLAQRGVVITVITTPLNAPKLEPVISRAGANGLKIKVVQLHFPAAEAGLPDGCENYDMLPSVDDGLKFFRAGQMMQPSVEKVLEELKPSPICLISDFCFPWTMEVASKFKIPRIVFHGMCCFALVCFHVFGLLENSDHIPSSDSEYFYLPGLPDKIKLTKLQLIGAVTASPYLEDWIQLRSKMKEAEDAAFGVVCNTFEALEPEYIKEYMKVLGKKVWCIGPVSLSNKDSKDKAVRGNKTAIDEKHIIEWLDSLMPKTALYVCLGTLAKIGTSQLIELGLGLESSNRPFIWILRDPPEKFKKWLEEEKFEERMKGRGLLINGWVPQVLILSHDSVGGFLTHCGWNSSLEGISAGLPLITWPAFADQFCNERLIVNVLGVGVQAGVEVPVLFGQEENMGVPVTREDIKMAVEKLMDGGEEGEARRNRAKELGEMARRAVEEGGSSDLSINHLIQDIIAEVEKKRCDTKYYGVRNSIGQEMLNGNSCKHL